MAGLQAQIVDNLQEFRLVKPIDRCNCFWYAHLLAKEFGRSSILPAFRFVVRNLRRGDIPQQARIYNDG